MSKWEFFMVILSIILVVIFTFDVTLSLNEQTGKYEISK